MTSPFQRMLGVISPFKVLGIHILCLLICIGLGQIPECSAAALSADLDDQLASNNVLVRSDTQPGPAAPALSSQALSNQSRPPHQGSPSNKSAVINLLSEAHTLHVLPKREESQTPYRAALYHIGKQLDELRGFIEGNETLRQGWQPIRDPHSLLGPYLKHTYSKSFSDRPNAIFDPYACRSHYFELDHGGQGKDQAEAEAKPSNENTTQTEEKALDQDIFVKYPFPPRAYWSTLSGTWKNDHWTLHPGFMADNERVGQDLSRPFELMPDGLRKEFSARQADLLTLLLGRAFPGAESSSNSSEVQVIAPPLPPQTAEMRGGKVTFQIGRQERLGRKGFVHGFQGLLSLWPTDYSPGGGVAGLEVVQGSIPPPETSPNRRRALRDQRLDARQDEGEKDAAQEKTDEEEAALNEYAQLFRYEKPNFKSFGPVEFDLDGLHFLDSGLLYAQALPVESSQYTDPREVLSMIPLPRKLLPPEQRSPCPSGPHFNNQSQAFLASEAAAEVMLNETFHAINETLNRRVMRNNASIYAGRKAELGELRTAHHNCSFHFYGHLMPVGPPSKRNDMRLLERELRQPAGVTTIGAPSAEMQAMLYSPDCFLTITLGPSPSTAMLALTEPLRAIRYAASLFAVLVIQSLVITRQMDRSATPSAIAKIAWLSWVLQCLLDVATFGAHIVAAIFGSDRSSKAMMACAFLSATLFIGLQYQHILTMWSVQAPEFQRNQPNMADVAAAAGDNGEPPEPETPVEQGGSARTTVEGGESEPYWQALNSRFRANVRQRPFAFVLIAFFLVSTLIPDLIANLIILGLYSFWIPQILRNVRRGTRKAVERRYIILISLCRLYLPLYFLLCPANYGQIDTNPGLALFLVSWVGGQVLLIIGQSFFGTHFFIPQRYRAKDASWDWHPPLSTLPTRQDPEISALTVGDCAVCLSAILASSATPQHLGLQEPEQEGLLAGQESFIALPMDDWGGSSQRRGSFTRDSTRSSSRAMSTLRSWLQPLLRRLPSTIQLNTRHDVMVTPCRHIFHTHCLEQWLQVKTECPQCRFPLPPV